MKKKLLATILFMTFITVWSGISILCTHISATATDKIDDTNLKNNNQSVEIYSQVMNNFQTETIDFAGGSQIMYSDDFAGVFIDKQGYLNIGIVADNAKINLLQKTSNYGGQVIFRQNAFSYNYLQKVQDEITLVMTEYGVNSVGIKDSKNQVYINLKDESNIIRIITCLQEKGLYYEAALNFIVENGELRPASTAYGGDELLSPASGKLGTICTSVVDNQTGKIGILTNWHVALDYVMYIGKERVGTSTKSQRSGTVDASFVPFENQSSLRATTYARYEDNTDFYTYKNIRLGDESLVIEGRRTVKIGKATGRTVGEITIRNKTIAINYGMYGDQDIVTLTNTFEVSNSTARGDSGGPVYFDDQAGNLFLIGMTFASQSILGGPSWGTACRITEVMNALDVTPITNDNYSIATLSNDTIRIDALDTNFAGGIALPDSLNGKTVTAINNYAFSGRTGLSSVEVPSTISSIGDSAFKNCPNLREVYINRPSNDGITILGSDAFFNTSLSAIYVPTAESQSAYRSATNWSNYSNQIYYATHDKLSFSEIGNYAYSVQALDTSISGDIGIPSTYRGLPVTQIPDNAFRIVFGITSVTIHGAITYIGNYAFAGCDNITSIIIPRSVAVIGSDAFRYCYNLTIYAEAASKPTGWDANWNPSNCHVVWNYCSEGITHSWSSANTTSHSCISCGAIAAHNWSSINATQHKCSECGATDAHSFYYSNMTALQHTKSCDCGYSVASKHMLTYKSNRQNHIGTCSVCGYSKTEPHIFDITYEMTGLGMVIRYTCATCKYSYDEPRLLTIGRKLVS